MADIQLIQCKNQQKTSSYRRNSVPYKEIAINESNDDVKSQNFNRKFRNGRSCVCAVKIWLKIALNAVRLPKFEPVNGISWSLRKIMVKGLRQRSGLAWFCACAESCVVFNTGPYTVLPDNDILNTANMQSETGFPSSHQLKSYVASKSRLKLAARVVLSADAGLLVFIYAHSLIYTRYNACSLNPPDSASQNTSRSVQPFLHSARHRVPILYNVCLKN